MLISTMLENDGFGKIKTISDDYESKKEMVKTYFNVEYGCIPFFDWGNRIEQIKFKSINDELIDFFLEELIKDITINFRLNIINYAYRLNYEENLLDIILILENGDTLELTKKM